ncbi:hypothetical protein SKAU_G00086710 [Synaphobranchus kaupii]|uniref:Uncharacterized protein n=1 Tax=Synaphobranchus kaupii TaxID=118154 RepID=A0A9Q1J639_SYNKA|nr:hypothetical protein SKAU_G00086710 [Synaphobranchus kaupii]
MHVISTHETAKRLEEPEQRCSDRVGSGRASPAQLMSQPFLILSNKLPERDARHFVSPSPRVSGRSHGSGGAG